jgi:hypothetical protein
MSTAPTLLDIYRASREHGSTAKGWRHTAAIARSHVDIAIIRGDQNGADHLVWLADDCEQRATLVEARDLVWGGADGHMACAQDGTCVKCGTTARLRYPHARTALMLDAARVGRRLADRLTIIDGATREPEGECSIAEMLVDNIHDAEVVADVLALEPGQTALIGWNHVTRNAAT